MSSSSTRIPLLLVYCSIVSALLVGTASAQIVVQILPNLEPFPASEVQLTDGGNTLRFSTTTWNRGAGPLELVGGEVLPDGTSQKVYQRMYLSDGSVSPLVPVGLRVPSGT